jgi:hypothetical protein
VVNPLAASANAVVSQPSVSQMKSRRLASFAGREAAGVG